MTASDDQKPVRLIATDIDGTMLRCDGTLSRRVRAALHDAVAAGIHVVPATGRPAAVAVDVIEALGLNEYWVFANGAVTRHLGRNELVRGFWMPSAIAATLVRELRAARPSLRFAAEFEHTVAFEDFFSGTANIGVGFDTVDDVADRIEANEDRLQKVLVTEANWDPNVVLAAVEKVVRGRAYPTLSGLAFVELAASNVTKATALQALIDDLGVAVEEVAAFGDNNNDVAMLEWAGRSFAMANATADAKAAAQAIIPTSDDEGLARAVEKILADQG